jgi:hypothetical protein
VNGQDAEERYREYLASFGISNPRDIACLHDLDVDEIHFFGYAGDGGLRLKAAVTPAGVVSPALPESADWHGFLSHMPDAVTAASRVAWLESDASVPVDGLPLPPVEALTPGTRPERGIDPAEWELVAEPVLRRDPGGGVALVAWFLPSQTRIPERWTISGYLDGSCAIERVPASRHVARSAGGDDAAAASERARLLLSQGEDDDVRWALQHIGDTVDVAASSAVAALLRSRDAGPEIRLLAAGTLARLADPSSAGALGEALRGDPAPEVRRASAQALGRIGDSVAVRLLVDAVSGEPDVVVRAEMVNALLASANPPRAALGRIAATDADASVRLLARQGAEDAG